jgi:hypothetical protein
METQNELKIGIGKIESEKISLKPAKVKIVGVKVEDTKKAKKVVYEVKHPDREESIHISAVAYLVDRAIKVSGTWFNLDKDGQLQKGSSNVVLLQRIGATTLEEAIGKEIDTELDGNYLCFKAY